MTKNEYLELFDYVVAGVVASAYMKSGAEISDSMWAKIRGEDHFTMRDLGEVGHYTGYTISLHLVDKQE